MRNLSANWFGLNLSPTVKFHHWKSRKSSLNARLNAAYQRRRQLVLTLAKFIWIYISKKFVYRWIFTWCVVFRNTFPPPKEKRLTLQPVSSHFKSYQCVTNQCNVSQSIASRCNELSPFTSNAIQILLTRPSIDEFFVAPDHWGHQFASCLTLMWNKCWTFWNRQSNIVDRMPSMLIEIPEETIEPWFELTGQQKWVWGAKHLKTLRLYTLVA